MADAVTTNLLHGKVMRFICFLLPLKLFHPISDGSYAISMQWQCNNSTPNKEQAAILPLPAMAMAGDAKTSANPPAGVLSLQSVKNEFESGIVDR